MAELMGISVRSYEYRLRKNSWVQIEELAKLRTRYDGNFNLKLGLGDYSVKVEKIG